MIRRLVGWLDSARVFFNAKWAPLGTLGPEPFSTLFPHFIAKLGIV